MKKYFKSITTSMAILIAGLSLSTAFVGNTASAAPSYNALDENNVTVSLPFVTQIETGDFPYAILDPIGVEMLNGISPRILINPDNTLRHSPVKVTMSDGTVLLQYNDTGWYVDQSQVVTNILR